MGELTTVTAAAAALARSGLPLALLVVTRGRALPIAFPVLLVRFPPVELARLLTVECRLIVTGGLLGDAAVPSRCRTDAPFLKLVTGGSGRGLPAAGVVIELNLFTGDSLRFRTEVFFTPVMNSCCTASSGFNRRSGSHRRQRAMKSRKASS